jgi:membrane-associated phospholipid phosphatase
VIAWIKDGFHRNTWWSRLLFCLPLLLASLLYPLTNQLMSAAGHGFVFKWALDDQIPYWEAFIIPYCYWHLQIYFTMVWLLLSRKPGYVLHRMVIALVIADLISAVFYLAMPTYMIRPEITGSSPLTGLVRLIYSIDQPYNCFPSKHVAWALIMNRAWAAAGPRHWAFRAANWTGTALIIASTVLVKQHYTPDILGGAAVAVIGLVLSALIWKRLGPKLGDLSLNPPFGRA